MAGWSSDDSPPPEAFWCTLVGNRNLLGCYSAGDKFALELLQGECKDKILTLAKPSRYDCLPAVREFLKRVQCVVWSRRLEHLQRTDMFGITSKRFEKCDMFCILKGCSVPVVLWEDVGGHPAAKMSTSDHLGHLAKALMEQDTRDVHYEFISEAFANGMMDSETYTLKTQRLILPLSFRLR